MRQGIIIVATLVDKLPNLAGLARTCEVCVGRREGGPSIWLRVRSPALAGLARTCEVRG